MTIARVGMFIKECSKYHHCISLHIIASSTQRKPIVSSCWRILIAVLDHVLLQANSLPSLRNRLIMRLQIAMLTTTTVGDWQVEKTPSRRHSAFRLLFAPTVQPLHVPSHFLLRLHAASMHVLIIEVRSWCLLHRPEHHRNQLLTVGMHAVMA